MELTSGYVFRFLQCLHEWITSGVLSNKGECIYCLQADKREGTRSFSFICCFLIILSSKQFFVSKILGWHILVCFNRWDKREEDRPKSPVFHIPVHGYFLSNSVNFAQEIYEFILYLSIFFCICLSQQRGGFYSSFFLVCFCSSLESTWELEDIYIFKKISCIVFLLKLLLWLQSEVKLLVKAFHVSARGSLAGHSSDFSFISFLDLVVLTFGCAKTFPFLAAIPVAIFFFSDYNAAHSVFKILLPHFPIGDQLIIAYLFS